MTATQSSSCETRPPSSGCIVQLAQCCRKSPQLDKKALLYYQTSFVLAIMWFVGWLGDGFLWINCWWAWRQHRCINNLPLGLSCNPHGFNPLVSMGIVISPVVPVHEMPHWEEKLHSLINQGCSSLALLWKVKHGRHLVNGRRIGARLSMEPDRLTFANKWENNNWLHVVQNKYWRWINIWMGHANLLSLAVSRCLINQIQCIKHCSCKGGPMNWF